ncbi:MAG: hypothetical protein KAJ51_07235, partial [Thermoplasmata archaeon]|nr:hypothetical protein [Thermoplasmata archaeon]
MNNIRKVLIILIIFFNLLPISTFGVLDFHDLKKANDTNSNDSVCSKDFESDSSMQVYESTRNIRGTWTDTFDIESKIETKANVNAQNGDVMLKPQSQFLITSTAEFNDGVKLNTLTNTDSFEVPQNELQMAKTEILIENFEGVNGQAIDAYDPSWTVDITDGATIKIANDQQIRGSMSAKWCADDTGIGNAKIHKTIQNYAFKALSLFVRINIVTTSTEPFAIKTFDSQGNRYATFNFGQSSGYLWKFCYYDGTTMVNTNNQIAEDVWYRLKIIHDTAQGTWDAWIDGGNYNNVQMANDANRYASGTNIINKLEIDRRSGHSGHHVEEWVDNITLTEYIKSGYWESALQNIPVDHQLKDTTITYSNLAPSVAEITRIEWRVSDLVVAAYDTNINNDGLSPFTISDSDLTLGTFKNIKSDFKIKIFLLSDGNKTPIITQIHGNLMPLKGHLVSTPITLYQNEYWDELSVNKTVPINSFINISILDPPTNQIIPGFENLSAINIDLKSINPREYLTIKLRANFKSDGEFFPLLHDWAVSMKSDPPKKTTDIPSDWTFQEDTDADNLIDLTAYFEDVWTSDDKLKFQIIYESDDAHIDASVDGKFLDFTTSTINWSGSETFKAKCTDEGGLSVNSNEFEVTVTEVNDPPVWTHIGYIYINEDSKLTDVIDLDLFITDCDDLIENITYSVISNNNPSNIFAQVANRHVWVEPLIENYYGSAIIKISANDGFASAEISFEIIIESVNDPPIVELLSPINNSIITSSSTVKLTWSEGFDIDGTIVSYDVY